MADAKLSVSLELVDKLSADFSKAMNKVNADIKKTTDSMVHLGREIQQTGRNLTFLGAAITGPMAIAFKTASDYSIEAGDALQRLTTASISFQNTIAAGMLPVIEKITRVIEQLTLWFNKLDPALRDTIIQTLLIIGVFSTLLGITISLAGRMWILAARIIQFASANVPLVLMATALLAIIIYWQQLRNIAMPIIDMLQIGAYMVAIGFEKMALAMSHVLAYMASMAGQFDWAVRFEEDAIRIENKIGALEDKIAGVMSGQNRWSDAIDTGMGKIRQFWEYFQNISLEKVNLSMERFRQTFEQTFKQAYDKAVNIGATSAEILVNQINMFSTQFGQAFGQMIVHGKNFGESMMKLFEDMAVAFIAEVTRMIAQWLIFTALTGGTGGAAGGIFGWIGRLFRHSGGMVYHGGGMIRAHSGLAVDEVPIIAQTGEGILSRKGMGALGGPGVLSALNKGQSVGGGINIVMQNVSFRSENDIEDVMIRLSNLITAKTRSRI